MRYNGELAYFDGRILLFLDGEKRFIAILLRSSGEGGEGEDEGTNDNDAKST